jgi:hypothetical protein
MTDRCTANGNNDGHPQGEDRLMGDVDQGHGANGRVTEAPRSTWLADATEPADRTNGTNGHEARDDTPLVVDVGGYTAVPDTSADSPATDPVASPDSAAATAPAESVGAGDAGAPVPPPLEAAASEPAASPPAERSDALAGPPRATAVTDASGSDGAATEVAVTTAEPDVDPTAALDARTGATDDDPYGGGPDWRESATGSINEPVPEGADGFPDDDALSGYLCGVCEEPLPYGAELCPACATPVAPLDEDELVAGPYMLDEQGLGGWPETTATAPWVTADALAPAEPPFGADAHRPTDPWAGPSAPPDPTVDLPAPAWPPAPEPADAVAAAPAQLWAPRSPSGGDGDAERPWPTLAAVDGPPDAPPAPTATPPEPAPAVSVPAPDDHGPAKTTRLAALTLVAVLIVGTLAVLAVTRGRNTTTAAVTATTTIAAPAPAPAPAPITGEPAGLPRSNPAQFCAALFTFRVVGEYDTVAVRFMTDSGPFVTAMETAAVTAPEEERATTAALVPLLHDLADKVAVRSIRNSQELQAVLLPTGTPAWGHIYEVILPAVIRHCAGRS